MKKILILISFVALFLSCKKNNQYANSGLSGTWANYSCVYKDFNYNLTLLSTDTVFVLKFDNAGNFTLIAPCFSLYNNNQYYPQTSGTYKIINDSILTIEPDTSYLLMYLYYKFNSAYFPSYPNGNTIKFKQVSSDSIILSEQWTLYPNSLNPSMYSSSVSLRKEN